MIRDLGGTPVLPSGCWSTWRLYAALQVSRIVTPDLARGEDLTREQLEDLARWQRELRDTLRVLGVERVEQAPPSLAELLAASQEAEAA